MAVAPFFPVVCPVFGGRGAGAICIPSSLTLLTRRKLPWENKGGLEDLQRSHGSSGRCFLFSSGTSRCAGGRDLCLHYLGNSLPLPTWHESPAQVDVSRRSDSRVVSRLRVTSKLWHYPPIVTTWYSGGPSDLILKFKSRLSMKAALNPLRSTMLQQGCRRGTGAWDYCTLI